MKLVQIIAPFVVFAATTASAQEGYNAAFIEDHATQQQRLIVTNTDYVSVYVNSVFVAQKESFMKKNNFVIDATLEVEEQKLTIPLYSSRDASVSGKLGIIHAGLLSTIPATGKPVRVGIRVLRRDIDDPLKRTLDALNDNTSQTLLKTYAATAVPYITLVGGVARQLYQAFGPTQGSDVMFQTNPIELSATDGKNASRFSLRDTHLLVYKSAAVLDSAKLSIDKDNNVLYDGKPLTGMRWVLFGIEKSSSRQDYTKRPWQRKYEQAMNEARRALVTKDFKTADAAFDDFMVLIDADPDYTLSDKNDIETRYGTGYNAIKNAANKGIDVDKVLASAMVDAAATPGPHTITTSAFSPTPTKVLNVDRLLNTIATSKDFK